MKYNYPIKQQNQHGPNDNDSVEFIVTGASHSNPNDYNKELLDVEIEISNSLFDMRREYKRTMKKMRHLYKDKESRNSRLMCKDFESYQVDFPKMHLGRKHVAA